MNYAIWYHYVAATNGDLSKTIDDLIRDQKPFDSDTSLKLYKTYVCNASVEGFEKINSALLQLTTQISRSVDTADEKASAVGDNLNVKLTELDSTSSQGELKSILIDIISETTKLAEASKDLRMQLHYTDKEMVQLRNELTHVRQTANIDGLTGLLNRMAFDKELDELLENATARNACLALLDIDHFKRVNDSFGHLVGDKVLRHVAALLKNQAAEHYQVARYGGEEMAIIMPDTTLPDAFKLIEQIRKSLDSSRLKYKNDTVDIGKVTVSAGISLRRASDGAYSLISRADKALYLAKNTGRNKVVTEDKI
jgi:diguanylate cyclase